MEIWNKLKAKHKKNEKYSTVYGIGQEKFLKQIKIKVDELKNKLN